MVTTASPYPAAAGAVPCVYARCSSGRSGARSALPSGEHDRRLPRLAAVAAGVQRANVDEPWAIARGCPQPLHGELDRRLERVGLLDVDGRAEPDVAVQPDRHEVRRRRER